MSKLFSDPIYERMKNDEEEWLNLAMEPFIFSLIDTLRDLPENVLLSDENTKGLVHIHLSKKGSIDQVLIKASEALYLEHKDVLDDMYEQITMSCLENMYDMTVVGDTIDVENDIYPSFHFKKVNDPDEEHIKDMLIDDCRAFLLLCVDVLSIKRLNELLDLFNLPKPPTKKDKYTKLIREISAILKEDRWKIRSGDLMVDFTYWVKNYLDEGNLKSLMMLTKLKAMSHRGEPIYSVGE